MEEVQERERMCLCEGVMSSVVKFNLRGSGRWSGRRPVSPLYSFSFPLLPLSPSVFLSLPNTSSRLPVLPDVFHSLPLLFSPLLSFPLSLSLSSCGIYKRWVLWADSIVFLYILGHSYPFLPPPFPPLSLSLHLAVSGEGVSVNPGV